MVNRYLKYIKNYLTSQTPSDGRLFRKVCPSSPSFILQITSIKLFTLTGIFFDIDEMVYKLL